MGYRPEKRYVQVMVALAAVGLLAMIVLTNIARRTHDQNLFLVVNAIRLASLVLTVWIMWSWYQTRDEREKLFALQVLAMVGALVLIETMALTLVVVGSASLTAVSIFFVLVGNFVFAAFALGFRRSLLERDRHALGRMALLLSAFMAPLLWWLLTLMFPLPGMTFRTGMWVFIVAWLLISCYLAFFKATEK